MNKLEINVGQKLKDLKLTPILKLSDFVKKKKRFYAGPFIDSQKNKVFLKLLITDDGVAAESIIKEIKIREFLKKFQDFVYFPHLIKYDDQNKPYWFISQYWEGPILGYFYEIYYSSEENIAFVVDSLFRLHKISYSEIVKVTDNRLLKFWQNNFENYFSFVKGCEKAIDKEIAKNIDFIQIYQLLESKKIFFQKSLLVFSHGDFTMANMVLTPEKMFITDWEHGHLDNFVHDLAHLWIQLWRYPKWRTKLLLEFIARLPKDRVEEFKNLFQAVVITEALGEIRFSLDLCPKKYILGAKTASLKTITAAMKGFDNLIKS